MTKPFLWNFIEKIEKQREHSDARETANETASEESIKQTIILEE